MQIMGHRGARGLAPENTLAGFRAGINAGTDWIEFDVRATKDGKIVVIHDAATLRVSNVYKRISRTSYKTLRQLKIFNDHTIPTLAEALGVAEDKVKVNIEIKSAGCAQAVADAVARQVKRGANYSDFMVSSFKAKYLREVHYLNPKIQLGLLHLVRSGKFLRLRGLRVQAVGFHRRRISKYLISQAKLRHLMIYVYTVNTVAEAKKLASMGVDGIVTDRPDLMQALKAK